MIDFDPISAAAARKAVDDGIYGTRAHARLEENMRAGVVVTSTTAELIDGARRWAERNGVSVPSEIIFDLADALEAATERDEWEWGVEYGFNPRAVEPMRDRDSAERFMANKPLWANPGHFIGNELVRRRPAGPWEPVGGTE